MFVGAAIAGTGAPASVTTPMPEWTTVMAASQLDFFLDQQTGQGDADIVGLGTNAGFYTGFDGTYVYYRVRLGKTLMSGGKTPQPQYKGLLWIGIDGNSDGRLDIFLGINNQGSSRELILADAGSGANISPSTTSIANPLAKYTIVQNSTNYNYQAVNLTMDPGMTNSDLNADGNIDAFLSVRIPLFSAVGTFSLHNAMNELAQIMVDDKSVVRYVIATSTQMNSLNQDLGGINDKDPSYDPTRTWAALGALTNTGLWTGAAPPTDVDTPEPATWATLAGGAAMLALARIRRSGGLGSRSRSRRAERRQREK